MTADDVNANPEAVRLLETAVPPIPPALLIAPYGRIRARARRRRAVTLATTAIAVVLLAVGGVVVATVSPWPPKSTVVGANTPTAARGEVRPIVLARVDRAGTRVMLYMNPPSDCTVYGDPTTEVVENDSTVRVTLRAIPVPVDCSRSMASTASLTLGRPLGDRTLIDGRAGTTVHVFPDANLPVVPGPWTEVPTEFTELDGSRFVTDYTRPGGPDLAFQVTVGSGLDPSPVERVQLGHRQGVIDRVGTASYEVDWTVGDLLYQMQLEPTEGSSVSLAQLHQVISQLTWD